MKEKLTLEKLEDRVLLNGDNGVLEINNIAGFHDLNDTFIAQHYPGGTEGYGLWDQSIIWGFDCFGAYTLIEGHDLSVDTRPITSTTPFTINLAYNGNLSEQTENHLEISMPYGSEYEFGTKPITIETETGQRYDVRQAIAEGEIALGVGKIPLENVPAGTSGDYATATVNFNNPADLNNDGNVDVVDLALLGENWLNNKAKGDYVLGDISGSEGKPDGVVNLHDLAFMSENWLMDDSAPASASESTMDALTGSYKEALVNEHDKKPKKSK